FDHALAQVIELLGVYLRAVEQQAPLFCGFRLRGADYLGAAVVAGAEGELALEAGVEGDVDFAETLRCVERQLQRRRQPLRVPGVTTVRRPRAEGGLEVARGAVGDEGGRVTVGLAAGA